jgi:hypothetical protein
VSLIFLQVPSRFLTLRAWSTSLTLSQFVPGGNRITTAAGMQSSLRP